LSTSFRRASARVLFVAATISAPAAAETGAGSQAIEARATTIPPTIDGRLDDDVWAQAVPFTSFVESFPEEGGRPSDGTELRVLYDENYLYIGFICNDAHPESIVRKLGDRDAPPVSDTVEVAIDFAHDHRMAYLFGINAGGVQYDRLIYGDNHVAPEWDAVWQANVASRPDGWSAEMAVPLRFFRFSYIPQRTVGFLAQRHITRTHEDIASVLLPRNNKGYVSLFGELSGLNQLRPRANLDLLPYVATRLTSHPQFSDPAIPWPHIVDGSLDVGVDIRTVISRLQLNLTINPDFGQIESDQIILNLTNQEAVFPEKRPFFFQGTEVFQPVGFEGGTQANQLLFYSRRIGLSTPVLGAAKLTGELAPRLSLGLLDAFVAGPEAASIDESAPDRRVRFHPQRPFHLGPNDEAVARSATPENYFAGVLTYKLGETSTIGLRTASAIPIADCTEVANDPGNTQPPPDRCSTPGNNAAAIDWSLRSPHAEWALQGQAEISEVVGGARARTLPDGVVQTPGQTGWGTYSQAGKFGGEPFRFGLDYSYISPTLELNGAGFLPVQNWQDLGAQLHYVRPTGFAGLHAFDLALRGRQAWSTDGRNVNRRRIANLTADAIVPGFHSVGIDTGYEFSYFDIREITGTGIPFERVPLFYVAVLGETDPARTLALSGSLSRHWTRATAVTPSRPGFGVQVGLAVRPRGGVESKLNLAAADEPQGPRWTGQALGDRFHLGDLQSRYLSLTFRQQVVLFPRLACQAYAQLFVATGRYDSFFEFDRKAATQVNFADLVPSQVTADGFYQSGLRINLVLRWEYRLGSTLFVVYNHASETAPVPGEPAPSTLAPVGLSRGRSTHTFLIKWSYYWHL
jgi:hypothetical protein